MADGAAAPAQAWWTGRTLVNGVFKGGGARGVAYAGALQAVSARGAWFGSVAGASAGAITATLVAAGMEPERIAAVSAEGLASVKRGIARTVLGLSNAVFANEGLEAWIEAQLRAALGGRAAPDDAPVTFAELYGATGIGLYVLTLDLHGREPLIFHHALTPDAAVAAAVVASCAIPGAFPSGRAVVGPGGSPTVRELVDGGAWANFPWFVFTDRAFRAWLPVADAAEEQRPVWGFVLDDELRRPRQSVRSLLSGLRSRRVPRRFDLGPAGTSGSVGAYAFSAVLGSDVIRLAALAVVVLWGVVTLGALPLTARWLIQTIGRSAIAPFAPIVVFGAIAGLALVAGLVVAVALGALAFGRVLADTVLPSAQSALGVATGVAPWIGAVPPGSQDRVVTVPSSGLRTTGFRIPDDARRRAVERAYEATLAQLDGRVAAPVAAASPALPTVAALMLRLVRTVLITGVVLRVLVWAVSDLESNHALRGIAWLVAAAIGLAIVLGLTARKARFRASHAVARTPDERATAARWGYALVALGGVVLLVGLVLGAMRFADNADQVVNARIIAAQVRGESNQYFFTGTERATGAAVRGDFVSDVSYRLGERLFMARSSRPGEEWRQAQQLTLDSFALPIVAVVLGLGLLGSGTRELRWLVRDRNLGAPTPLMSHRRRRA